MMPSVVETEVIMAGGASRNLKKEGFWRRMVRRQASSGVSVQAFCRGRGLAAATFYWWRAELGRRDSVRDSFVPVQVVPDDAHGTGGRIEVVLASGRRLVVSGRVDRAMLADVMALLEEKPAC
jgi:hypothetical protein